MINRYGIDSAFIAPGDTVMGLGLTGIVSEVKPSAHTEGYYRIWGFWEGRNFLQFLGFDGIQEHIPKLHPYDPKQQPEDDSI